MNPLALRWGILGTGMIANKFATDLASAKHGSLQGTASRSRETADGFAGRHGGAAHAGYDSLLSDPDIDAIYVALPNTLHREWTTRALDAGKHVLCEKPLALRAEEAEELFAHARKCDRHLVEAFMYRAHPQTQRLFRLVAGGLIGELQLVRANFTFRRPASRDDARYQPDEGGGSLMDVGCYCTDFIRTLAGEEPVEARAVTHAHEFGVDDYAAGVLRFDGGLLATFTCGMTVVSDQTAHIAGTKGRIEIPRFWRGEEGFTVHPQGADAVFHSVEETRPIYAVEADGFADLVSGGENWNPPANSIGNMRVLDRLRGM